MRKYYIFLLLLTLIATIPSFAQDEGSNLFQEYTVNDGGELIPATRDFESLPAEASVFVEQSPGFFTGILEAVRSMFLVGVPAIIIIAAGIGTGAILYASNQKEW